MSKKCPKCGMMYTDEAIFCGECGVPLIDANQVNKPQSRSSEMVSAAVQLIGNSSAKLGRKTDLFISKIKANIVKCENCGAYLQPNAKYCDACGHEVVRPKQLICSKCGAPLRPKAKFCGECGELVKYGEAESKTALKKCSLCGKMINAEADSCPECGMSLVDIGASVEVSSEIICPQCGNQLPPDSCFCNKCGMPVDSNIEEPTQETIVCKNCGEEIPFDSFFCLNCGCTIREEQEVRSIPENALQIKKSIENNELVFSVETYCTSCGMGLPEDALFCPECGKSVC